MENAIYQSMISAINLLDKQAIIANNLANISTTGFKESFNILIKNTNLTPYEKIKKYYDLSPGNVTYTQNNLDVALKQNDWLVVKDRYGKEAYTKNGHLQINKKGNLIIQNHEVVGKNGSIFIPTNKVIKILPDGTIQSVQRNNINPTKLGSLKLVNLPNDKIIQKENGFFYLKNQNNHIIPHNKNIRIMPEMLESSNVNPTKNMIDMISNARQYEMNIKIISMCDQNEERANQLFNINF